MKRFAAATSITCLAFILSGCYIYNPTAEFVKQRYTNGVSYFNTFYNAQRAFDEAEEEVITAQKEFREKPNTGRQFIVPQSARSKFTTSIEKNSKVLSFYPQSKWVDDALLMIGKAYYYIHDDVRAERKFLELAVKFPESDLIDESSLFLGRSLIRQRKVDEGLKRLNDLLEKTLSTDENIAGRAAFELAEYYFSENDFEQAEKLYSQSLPLLNDEEQQAQVQFQIARCFQSLKQYESAEVEYQKVDDYAPGYTLQFSAALSQARAMALQKKYTEAIEMMESMLDDTKNKEFYPSIHFAIANALYERGDRDAAVEKYRYIDTAFVRTEESARSYFALAQYYENIQVEYDSARVYYSKARSEFPASEITGEASRKAEIFTKYHTFKKDLGRFDSLVTFTARQKELDDSLYQAVADSLAVSAIDSTSEQNIDPKLRKATKPGKKSEAKKDTLPAFDSTRIKAHIAKGIAHTQLVDSLKRSIIRTEFELGGLFFLELPVPDSSLYWFNHVVAEHPQSEFAPRAMYTIAEIYRTVKERPRHVLDSIYTLIVAQYPSSPYAQESRKILGMPIVEAVKDSAAELLERAEAFADVKDFAAAIKTYSEIIEKHSTSPLMPKAIFSTGWHYENSLMKTDSALAVYRRLIAAFPSSTYAAAVRSKVTEYDNEQKRIEQEKQKLVEEQKMKEQKEKEEKEARLKQQSLPADSLRQTVPAEADSLKDVLPVKQDSLSTSPRER